VRQGMPELPELHEALFRIVQELQPCTVREVVARLKEEHGIELEQEAVRAILEEMRMAYPRRTVHAGPDRWGAVEVS